MINQDKQYIVVSNGETYRFSDADWTANKDEFMKDNPSAEIAEVDRYSVDDSQEGDFISVMAGGQSYGFNANDWNANQEEFLKDFPDAQPYRMRGVDYHYDQAISLEEALADNKKRKEAWEARRKEGMSGASLAEIAALEAGLDPIIGTFSEGAGAAKAYLDEGRQIEEERIRLQEQYDNNPRVKEAQEKWEKEQAEYEAQYPTLLREQINKDYEEFLGTVPKAFKSETMETGFDDVNLGEAIRMLTKGKEYREQQFDYEQNEPLFRQALIYLDDAEKIANAPSVADETNGFVKYLKSMGDRFSEVDFWSRGLAEAGALASGGDKALNKFQQLADEKGDGLTEEDINAALSPAERAYVLALTHKIAVQAERANEFASDDVKLSRAYNIGRGTADMVGYMAEFLLSGNISGGASKAATNAVAKWLVKNGVSRLTKSAIKGTVGKAAAKAIGKNALKGASKVLTSVLSKSAGAVAGGAARTPFTLSLAGNIADRRTSMDENGRFHGMDEAALYGTFDTAVENFSEEMGGAIGDVLGLPFKAGKGAWKAMTRNVDFGKIGGAATRVGNVAQRVANSKAFAFLKNAGFHGPLEEVGEEFVGAAVRDVTIEPEAWEQMANKESVIDLMVTFAPMTALGMAGTAGQMIHVSNEAKSKMEKLSQLMLAKGFDQQQVDYLTDYMRSTTPEKLREEMVGIWTKMANESGLGANVMQSEIGKAVIEAAYATAQYQTLFGAKQAQEAQQREAKKAELEEKYNGKFYGEDGMVRRHTLSNGKTVFQLSDFAENGDAAAIDAETGAHIIFKESDIAVETDKDGKQHKRSDSQSLDSYLSGEVMALNTTWEYARMQKDRQDQINALAQSLPAAINLGTQGDSKMAPVKEHNAQGVTVVDENGDEIALTWEQVGQKLGKPIKVLTDAEIAEIEAQEIAMRSNERRAGRAQTQQEAADTEAEINDTNKRIADLTPNPEEAYRNQETGEIDEDAFWENDPEGWADYNDRMMMDNGQDSMEQIESGLTLLAKQMSELDKMKSDSPNARKTIKAQKANLQAKIDRLVALQQKYAQISISEEEKRVEQTLQYRERIDQWRKQYGVPVFVYESEEEVKDKGAVAQIRIAATPGWQNSKGVHIYLPHVDSMATLEETLKHETTGHAGFALLDEKSYNELMDKVWAMMSDSARNTFYNYASVANTKDADTRRRKAAEEFASHVAEQVDLGKASAEQKTIWERIVDFFRRLFSDDNLDSSLIANAIRDNHLRLMEKAQQAQQEVNSFKAEAQERAVQGLVPEEVQSDAKAADGTNSYSTATFHSWVDNLGHEHTGTREEVLTRMQNMGFSEAEIKDMAQRMDTAYAYMEKLRRLTNPDGTVRFDEFNKWAEKTPLYKQIGRDYVKAITSLVSNGDYPVNLEITTDCIKREAFTQLLNELVKRGAELSGMGPGEIVTIQKMMKQYGIEVACNLCFVEGKRLQIINWASQIVNDWNDALVEAGVDTDEFFEFGKDGDAFIPADEWRTYEDKSKVAKVMRNLDDIALLFQGLDPKTFKAQKRKNKKALDKYIKEKAEKAKKPVDQWKPSDEQKREMKKIANEGLYPTYVNENMEEYRNAFNAMRNEWLDKNPNADPLSFNPTQKQWEALGKIRNRQIDNVRAKMVRLIMEYPEMRKKMTLNDLLGSKGLMEIRQQHGQAYADLYSIILQRFGTGTPKPVQDAVPYDGEVMTLSESAFKKANEIGGARLFSFSDFDITKVFDYMQMFFDLEANRQMLQSYTKEVAAVLIFGRSNAKFNISTLANAIVPDSVKEEYNKASEEKKQELRHKWAEYAGLEVDAEGNIIGINFSEEHSVSPAFAQQIFHDDSRNKDCGAIMVGASVNHAIFSAAQQWIRMVIPFHLSGMPLAAREKTDVKWYTDNTAYQSTRKKTKDGWSKISSSEDTFKFYNDMSKEGWNMRDKTREYLAWCAEKGFRPKFDWGINSDYYRAYCEENGYTPNQQIIDIMDADTTDGVWNQYYKFLTDFTAYKPVFNEQGEMIDEIPSPQLPVQSNFDFSEMEKDVLFEGERSMLEHREGNIQRTNRHIEILAEQATAYLNGDITEEEMGLRDDVHFENTADAERYLEEVAKKNDTNMYRFIGEKGTNISETSNKDGDNFFKTRTDSQREKLFADAKERFGVTDNFKVAGYMLPDGSLLDFSEANDGGDPNQRSLDHRSIEDVIMEDGTEYDSRWMYLADFMNEGAIRLLPEYAGINLMKAPTKEQRQRLMDFIYKYNGEVILEIADERLNNAAYVEYDRRTSPARIFRDIDGYFNEGIVPQSNTMFKTANNNQAIFVSNAAKAVEGIKMEKATPEQWLKMIEKNGGLKAGEDKWMGLSDFLKASDKKTLSKQEVLDFVNENMIQIEEVHYDAYAEERASDAHSNIVGVLQNKFNDYVAEYHEEHGYEDEYDDPASKYAIEKLREEMEDTFPYTIELVYGNEVYVTFDYEEEDEMVKWAEKTGVNYIPGENPINSTRLDYTTDGLENKHEIALTVPNIESWHESDDIHFGDAGEGRAVAWIRFGETKKLLGTTEMEGKKKFNWARVLVIDEIQSKRHQEGREKGYKSKDYWPLRTSYLEKKTVYESLYDEMAAKYGEEFTDAPNEEFAKRVLDAEDYERIMKAKADFDAAADAYIPMRNAIPDAPFDKNWHELAMKRMLRYAAENGYDVIAWTKGEQQTARYGLGGVVSAITMAEEHDGFIDFLFDVRGQEESSVIGVEKETGIVHLAEEPLSQAEGKPLSDLVGKEMAVRMMQMQESEVLDGADLQIGGEGMKGFYDRMLPAFMNKYGKKWGVKVEDIHLNLEGGLDMHSIPVTEEMKESVMEGQTMFKTKHPQEFAKQFMEGVVNDFYNTYETAAHASVVYVKNRRMVEEALGFGKGEMPDWLYERVKEEAKGSGAYLVNMQFQKEDGTEENRRRILIFAKEDYRMSADVDRIIFHENTHGWILDHPELLELGKWLAQSDNKTIQRVVGWVKDAYKEESWANEMLSDYVGRMLSIGKGQMALDLIPDEYKPLLNNIYEKFGYRPEQEDGRRVAELIRDAETLQMRDSELGEPGSDKTLFKTGISPEVRKEMDVISATAIVNGNYMKAPNGKDSKLTPEQWAMVRTKNFKRWFGDWENDPANASKVVDENGEPLVVYHGSPYGSITTFDRKGRTQSGLKEFGTYFATNKKLAELYAYARQQAKKDIEAYEAEKEKLDAIIFNPDTPAKIALDAFDELDKLNESQKPRVYEVFLNIKQPKVFDAEGKDGWNGWHKLKQDVGYDIKYGTEAIEAIAGHNRAARMDQSYDGIIAKNIADIHSDEVADYLGDVFLVFDENPNQIKSATDNTGEFSEDADIRFKTDTQGRSLSREQQEFFANSKAVDKDGNLLVLYHGTPRAGFTEFKSGWFTTSKEDAISYSGDRKGRMFDPNEKYEPETLSAGDFRLGYMTFDSEEDRAAFLAEHPTAESAMSESEYENARIQAEDEEYDTLTERKPELQKIWDAYREYERDHFVDTTIGEILNNPDAYTEDDLRRAVLAYDSNAVFDSIDELETTEERKSALVDSLNYMNEDAKENGAEGILDMVVATRVPRNGEGIKHNDLGNRTYEVYARIESPYEIDANGRGSEFESGDIYQSVKDALADEQYDGVIIRNWRVGRHQQLGDVVVPKNGKQVKLTSNENPTESEDIRFKTAYHGSPYSFDEFSLDHGNQGGSTGSAMFRPFGIYATDIKGRAMSYAQDRGEGRHLYELEIPDDGLYDFDGIFTREDKQRILDYIEKERPELFNKAKRAIGVRESRSGYTISDFLRPMDLQKLGYKGFVKYMHPAFTKEGDPKEFVIFNPQDIKVVKHYETKPGETDWFEKNTLTSDDAVAEEGTTLFKTTAEDYAAMPVDELVEKGKMRVSAENQLASDEFMNRIRAINGSLNQLRMAASAQRKYDKNTVQILASLANDLLASGKIADPSKGEVKRLISVLSNATGQNDLTKYVDRLMDIMIANQLRHGRENFDQFLRIRGKKVDARGVEVKGRLDIPGQQIMDAIRANIGLDLVDILFNIIETEDKLTSESETIRRNAENELIGLEFAKQYVENIRQSENEEKALRKEVKDAEAEYKAGARDRKSYTDFVKVTDEAIRENRTQRVLAYQKLIDDLAKMVTSSVQGSKLFNEAEKARVAKIQHFANSDMQGMPADAHVEAESKFWNNGLVRLFTSPLATFEQWLRVFGAKSAEGKGYLYNHFMGSWAKATDQMYLGMKDANAALDAKAREVFGNKVDRWSDLFAMEKELSKGKKHTISFWDDGEMKEYEVTQGNLLYIYMVNKMIDGKMKLRKMGISEDDVDAIVREIDPRFIALADWIQEEFLPGIRDKYNAVHERLFGAPMAAIDNYFPIKVLANARVREVDLGTAESSSKPSTITGSIIKRTKNGLALDVLHSDAFDVVLEHIEQMEQWAAFAEFNRDLNTLLSYKKFRNRVQNMSGVLGAGKEAWNSFRETAEIAAGVYQPKTAKADKLVTNAVKGLTAGKISFRLWTALKQVLSMPAFFPYVTPGKMAYSMATPWKAWNWAMENLPAFEKRWKSREAGNVRLKKTEADYKIWQGDFMETATRLGMTPNAFVDAVTCAIGSHAVYLTQKERYVKDGYNEEDASAKAKADAMVAFNATQQSSESAFLSAVQSDRTFIAHALTVFRNNSFGMQRELVDALRNFKKRMKSGFKAESIEFMKKQMVRDGLTEEQAERAANRVYRNSVIKDAARVATFGFLMQFLWNLGGSAIYLLFGDDDEEKEQMIKDAAIRGAFGSIEGLGFGNVITEGLSMAVTGDLKKFHPSLSPAEADIETLWNEMLTDPVAGANELINILVQAGIGVNPQVLTDAVVAIVDACDGDIEKSKEVGIALLRILQVPQSQIDKLKTDEIDFTNDIGLDITIEEFAKEYAQYKKWRNAPLTNALYSDEKERKVEDKYIKRFLKDAEALKRTRGNEEAKAYYQYLDTEYKEVSETINNLNRQTKEAGMKGDMVGSMEFAKMLDDFTKTDAFKRYVDFGGKAKAIESLRDKMKKVDMKTRTTIEDAMLDLRKEMVEEMEQAIN